MRQAEAKFNEEKERLKNAHPIQDFDELDFETLLSMAEVSQSYSAHAARVFRRKFAASKFVITNDSPVGLPTFLYKKLRPVAKAIEYVAGFKSQEVKKAVFIENEDYMDAIEMNDYKVALSTLRHFGKHIQQLKIVFANAESYQAKKLTKSINKYCSESLLDIEFDVNKGNALKRMSEPFTNVENVKFWSELPSVEKGKKQMNETFPALRTLTLASLDLKSTYLTCSFKHLEHLEILSSSASGASSGDHVIFNSFAKNPQIHTLGLHDYAATFLGDLTVIAPQLQHITLWSVKSTIQHDKVTKLSVRDRFTSPKLLAMPNVQELEMFYDKSYYNEWLNFLIDHEQIKRLVLEFKNMEDEDFSIFTEILPNLEEMVVASTEESSIGVEAVVDFAKHHKQLKKFILNSCTDDAKQTLRSEFENEWEVKDHFNGLRFEKKE